MAPEPSQQHQSYLLRLWRAGNGNAPQWRMSLEDARTHQRHGFNDLASMVAFLEEQIAIAARPAVPPDSSVGLNAPPEHTLKKGDDSC